MLVAVSFASGYFLGKQEEETKASKEVSVPSRQSKTSTPSQPSSLLESVKLQVPRSELKVRQQHFVVMPQTSHVCTEDQEAHLKDQTVDYLKNFIMRSPNENLIYRAIDTCGEQAANSKEMFAVASEILYKNDLGRDNILKVCKELSEWTIPENEVRDLVIHSASFAALPEQEQREVRSEVDDILETKEEDIMNSSIQETGATPW